jgi:hypothetical protein
MLHPLVSHNDIVVVKSISAQETYQQFQRFVVAPDYNELCDIFELFQEKHNLIGEQKSLSNNLASCTS